MSWPKQKPLTWTWFQESCAPDQIAERCAKLAKARFIVKFAVNVGGDIILISCKGTPKIKAKKKSAADAAKGE